MPYRSVKKVENYTVDRLADNGYWDREPDLNKKTKMGGFLKKKVSNKNTKSALPGAKYPWLFDSRIELNRKISVCESIDLYTYTDDKVGTKYRLEVMINPDRSEMYRTYTLRDGGFLIGQYSTLAEAESHIGDNFVGFKNPAFKGFKPVHKTKNEKKRPFKKRK